MLDRTLRTELSRRFIAGEPLAIRVPVPVEPKPGSRLFGRMLRYSLSTIGMAPARKATFMSARVLHWSSLPDTLIKRGYAQFS